MADLKMLEAALVKADAAGNTQDAKALADAIRAMRAQPSQEKTAPKSDQSFASGILDSLTQGASMGFGDELTALESAVLGRKPGGGTFDLGNYDAPFSERYKGALSAERGQQDAFSTENPVTAGVAEVAGALGTGIGAVRSGATLMGKAATRRGALGLGATEGAAYGGVSGAGYADEGDRMAGAAGGALTGAAVGGALTAGGQKIADVFANRAAKAATPSMRDLKNTAGAAFDAARAKNPSFPGFDQFAAQAPSVLAQEGFHPRLHPKVAVALSEITDLAKNNPTPDFKTLEKMRRIARAAAGGIEPDERRLGKMLVDGLDKYVEATSPVPEVKIGRELWSRVKKGEMVDEALGKAERRAASTGSGGNTDNAMRQNIRAILDNPKKRRGFTADEIAAMEEVVRGGPVQNLLRLVGKLSPQGNGLMAALGLGATVANPLMAIAPAVGMAAKPVAEKMTASNAAKLAELVRRGGVATPQPALPAPNREALLRAMSAYIGGKGGATAGAR